MTFDFEQLRERLVCPQSHAALVLDGDRLVSSCPESRLAYAVVDEIPIMLVDDAEQLSEAEWAQIMREHGRDATTGKVASEVPDA